MAKFNLAVIPLMKNEGVRFRAGVPSSTHTGYSNNPRDRGKETNYGITIALARKYGYRGSMRRMTYPEAVRIYKARFWDGIRGDDIPHQGIAEEMLDTGANCGRHWPGKFLQQALNALNGNGKYYRKIAEDGKVGPATIRTLKRALKVRSYYATLILRVMDSSQCERYRLITKRRPSQKVFFGGWVRARVGNIRS